MALEPGGALAHYRLVEKIGEGGMGVVWKAEDTRLHRHVAVKVLPTDLVGNERRRQRFVREARVAAAVTHPNIATIHEIGDVDGTIFIVMELIEGRTLRSLLHGQPLPIAEELRIALQMTDALARAHQAKIIHRDLKPDNVMIGNDGHVRLLDFGLGKLLEEQDEIGRSQLSHAPTMSDELTREGKVLGTAAYMSPEQARGKRVDARSDIFSCGVTLYEMSTGQRPFQGPTPMDTLSSVLNTEPVAPSRINGDVPEELDRIIARCLRKDPDERYQDTRDLLVELRQLKRETDSQPLQRSGAATRSVRRRRWLGKAVLAVLAVGLVAISTQWIVRNLPRDSSPRIRKSPLQTRLTMNPADLPVWPACISPDGSYLAYSDRTGHYLRVLETGEIKKLSLPEGASPAPSWFPDGSRLLLDTEGPDGVPAIAVYSVLTGSLRTIRENAYAYSVSPDGTHIAYVPSESEAQEIWVMDTGGGNERAIVRAGPGESVYWWLTWSPNGQRVAYRRGQKEGNAIETVDLQGGNRTVVLPPQTHIYPGIHGVWVPDGRIVFTRTESQKRHRDMNFWEIEVDNATGKALSEPRRLTDWADFYFYNLSVTRDGKSLAFVKWRTYGDFSLAELKGNGLELEGVRRLTAEVSNDVPRGWTPDSRYVLFGSDRGGTSDLFKLELASGQVETILSGPEQESEPVATSDGAWILYRQGPRLNAPTDSPSSPTLLMRLPAGGGSPQRVEEINPNTFFECGSRPGSGCILIEYEWQAVRLVIHDLDPLKGRGEELARVEFGPSATPEVSLSADATRVAIVGQNLSPTDANQARIIDLRNGHIREIPVEGLETFRHPQWSADGDGFYAFAGSPQAVIRIDLQGRVHEVAPYDPERDVRWYNSLMPSPDGRYLLLGHEVRESSVWKLENF